MHNRQGRFKTLLRFLGGAVGGGIVTSLLFLWIYPPHGSDYGEGIGYGLILQFFVFVGGVAGGLFAITEGRKPPDAGPNRFREYPARLWGCFTSLLLFFVVSLGVWFVTVNLFHSIFRSFGPTPETGSNYAMDLNLLAIVIGIIGGFFPVLMRNKKK